MVQPERFGTSIKDPHLYWWLGHVWHIVHAILYFASVLSLKAYSPYYQRAYLGSLLSYGITIWKSVELTSIFRRDIFANEPTQYFILAFYWYSYRPITVTLIPFCTFSIFHAFDYLHSTLVPSLFPPSSSPASARLCSGIKQYTDKHRHNALRLAAYAEVVGVLGRLIIGVITFRISILALINFGHFLFLRWYLSPGTREALQYTVKQLDMYLLSPLAGPRVPHYISNAYAHTKGTIIRYGNMLPSNEE